MSLFFITIICFALWALAQWTDRNIDDIRLWLKRKTFQRKLKNQLSDFKNLEDCSCEKCSSDEIKTDIKNDA